MEAQDKPLGGDKADDHPESLDRIPSRGIADRPVLDPTTGDGGPPPTVAEFVAWMLRRVDTPEALPKGLREARTHYRDDGQSLHPLVDRLLDLCRMQTDQRGLEPASLDLRERLVSACESLEAVDESRLVIGIDEDVPDVIHGDGELIEQVVAILASATALESGRDDIQVHVERVKEAPHAGSRAPVLSLHIQTTGSEDSPSAPGQPTGIGDLAMGVCEELVSAMSGSLELEIGGGDAYGCRFSVPAVAAQRGASR